MIYCVWALCAIYIAGLYYAVDYFQGEDSLLLRIVYSFCWPVTFWIGFIGGMCIWALQLVFKVVSIPRWNQPIYRHEYKVIGWDTPKRLIGICMLDGAIYYQDDKEWARTGMAFFGAYWVGVIEKHSEKDVNP